MSKEIESDFDKAIKKLPLPNVDISETKKKKSKLWQNTPT